MHTHTHIHTFLHIYLHTYTCPLTLSHKFIHTHILSHLLTHSYTFSCTHIVTQVHTHTYTHILTHTAHILTHTTHILTEIHTHTYIFTHSHAHSHLHTHTHTYTYTHAAVLAGSSGSTQCGEFCPINSSAAGLHAGQALTFNLHLWHESPSALILRLFALPAVKWIERRAIPPWCGALTPPVWGWWSECLALSYRNIKMWFGP